LEQVISGVLDGQKKADESGGLEHNKKLPESTDFKRLFRLPGARSQTDPQGAMPDFDYIRLATATTRAGLIASASRGDRGS
jgi:hypothetical protein